MYANFYKVNEKFYENNQKTEENYRKLVHKIIHSTYIWYRNIFISIILILKGVKRKEIFW